MTTPEARSVLTLLSEVFPDLSGEAASQVAMTRLEYSDYCECAARRDQDDEAADEPAPQPLDGRLFAMVPATLN